VSGGTLRIRLADGDEYEMPEQEAFPAMQDLERRGVKFAVSEVPVADSAHPDEAPRLASEDAPPPRAPDEVRVGDLPEQPSSWRQLYDKITSGGADADALKQLHAAQPKNPTTAMVENVAGMLAPPILKGSSFVGRLGASAVNQGVSGAGSGALNAALEGKDIKQGAGWGAALGLLGGGAGELAGSVVQGAGKLAGGVANRARIAAAGLDANTRKELAKKFGVADLPASLASLIERVSPSPRWGQSALTRAEGLAGKLDDIGPRIDDVLREAGDAQGLNAAVPDSWEGLQRTAVQDAAAAQGRAVPADQVALANALEAQAARLSTQPAPADLVGLRQRNTEWGRSAFGDGLTMSDKAGSQAAGQLRDLGEATLDDLVERAGAETAEAFHGLNKDYGEAAMLEKAARNRAAVEAGDTKAPGGVAAMAAAAANGVPGLVSGATSGTRNWLSQALGGSRGLDLIANAARGASRPLESLSGTIRAGGNGSGAIAGRIASGLARQDLTDEERRRLLEERGY
jgi:hypothetical protein